MEGLETQKVFQDLSRSLHNHTPFTQKVECKPQPIISQSKECFSPERIRA